jgi:hypothetical protein
VTDPELRKPVGIWRSVRALGDYRVKDVLWPDAVLGLVVGGGGAFLVVRSTELTERTSVAGNLTGVVGALLAVVFAALAIVVALPASRYLDLLGDTPDGGMRRFLDPFLVAIGTQIALVLLVVTYRLLAADVAWWIEHLAFYALGVLLVYGILDIGGLARSLVRHGILRAADAAAQAKNQDGGAQVRNLDERRGG